MATKVLISTGSALKTYSYGPSSSSANNTAADELVLQSSIACVPSCVVAHPDGSKYLTVARATNQLVVWDNEGKRICVLKRSDADAREPIVAPAFLERQSVVFASGSTSYIYQPSSSAAPTSYTGHPTGSIITTLALNSDHTAFATGSNQGTLLVHNLTTHSQSTLHCKPKAPYTVLAYHPTRRTFLVAATSTGVIHLHDTTKPSAPLRSFTLDTSPLPSPINALAFSAVSSLLLACTSAGRLYFVDTATMKVLPTTIEVGAEVEQRGMQMEGKLVWFRGAKGVRLLDLKRREKGVRELKVCEGKDRVAGMAIQSSGSSKKTAPTSTTKASGVLQDSLNRMRAAKHDATLQEVPTLGSIAEMFSPVKFSRPAYEQSQSGTERETESEDDQVAQPRRQAFADAIRQDPRQSTTTRSISAPVPPTVLRTSFLASTSQLSTSRSRPRSSVASVSSPSLSTLLPSMSLTPTYSQSRTPRADTTASTYRGGISPVGTNMTVNTTTRSSESGDRTIGEIARRLVLPELEVTEVFVVPGREEVQGRVERKSRRVGFAGGSAERQPAVEDVPPLQEAGPESEEEEKVDPEEEVKRGGPSGGELMKAAIKEVMEEFQSRTSREIQNLHLEIIRQSFAQKKEMKAMQAVLMELKEDNARLQNDNARLRRGY